MSNQDSWWAEIEEAIKWVASRVTNRGSLTTAASDISRVLAAYPKLRNLYAQQKEQVRKDALKQVLSK